MTAFNALVAIARDPVDFARVLYEWDLSRFDDRRPPETEARVDQHLRTMSPLQQWWAGLLTGGSEHFGTEVPVRDLHNEYRAAVPRYAQPINQFAAELLRLRASIAKRRAGLAQIMCYALPPQQQALADFRAVLGLPATWGADDADEKADAPAAAAPTMEQVLEELGL